MNAMDSDGNGEVSFEEFDVWWRVSHCLATHRRQALQAGRTSQAIGPRLFV